MDFARHTHTRASQRDADILSQTRHVKIVGIGTEFANSIAHSCPNAHTRHLTNSNLYQHTETHFNSDLVAYTH